MEIIFEVHKFFFPNHASFLPLAPDWMASGPGGFHAGDHHQLGNHRIGIIKQKV